MAILYISGKIDMDSAALIEEIGRLLREGISKILCNFSNVEVVDYNGLSIIAIAYKNAVNQKGMLKFCAVPRHVKDLLRAARLDRVFEMHDTEETALKTFDVSSNIDRLSLRRRFKRIDMNVPVRYKVGLSAGTKFLNGKILNLSGAGLFILSKDTLPVSSEIYMEIKLVKRQKPLTLTGTVAWLADKELQLHTYPGMGVSFENLDRKAQAVIVDFINRNITHRSKI